MNNTFPFPPSLGASMDFNIPKRVYCIAFTVFERTKLYPFQNLSLGFILKIFLKFRTFQPRYS